MSKKQIIGVFYNKDMFAANGIEISFPQMDLHLRSGDFTALAGQLAPKAEDHTPADKA